MQLTGNGDKQCTGQVSAMEASNDVVFEKSPKGQVRRPTRPEHVIAFEFLKIHYEEDVRAETPVQKSDVYSDYERHCQVNSYKPLVAADFGRILKSMFPNARDRRLGSRGSSKYCYVGVKRKSEDSSQTSSLNPYSAEDLSNAYQTVVCEWASAVLSRRMQNLGDLAKYLLKHRFVQTRSCAALTITASLKDTEELAEVQPMNKHREMQLKLQEKLLNKRLRAGSVDELQLAERIQGAFSRNQSACSTPDSEGQLRLVTMQTSSAPGSRRTSPEHTAMSVTNSACASPASVDMTLHKNPPAYHPNNHRNGYEVNTNDVRTIAHGALTAINSQCNSAAGSERNTPVAPLYNNTSLCHSINTQPHYQQYDPRIQSCPNTPLPSYQQQQRFEFQPQNAMSNNELLQQQCMSLPGSARNTPVIPEYQDASESGGYYVNLQRSFTAEELYQPQMAQQLQQQFSQSFPNFQRHEFSRNNNSAFIPIKDGGITSLQPANLSNHMENTYDEGGAYNDCPNKPLGFNTDTDHQRHSDSVELEINELFNIIESNEVMNSSDALPPSQPHMQNSTGETNPCDGGGMQPSRPLSAQGPITHNGSNRLSHQPQLPHQPPSTSGSVIYDLLKSGTNHTTDSRHLNQRYRHHSGPQLGHGISHKSKYSQKAASKPMTTTLTTHAAVTAGVVDPFNSPPSTPNGNFRPVHTPSRELRMFYGGGGEPQQAPANFTTRATNNSPANIAIPARFSNSLVGTMSPPAQPLSKRKRNHSGGKVGGGSNISLTTMTSTAPSATVAAATTTAGGQEYSDFVARRNLGNQLLSPIGVEESATSNSYGGAQKGAGHAMSNSTFHEDVAKPTANRSVGIDQR